MRSLSEPEAPLVTSSMAQKFHRDGFVTGGRLIEDDEADELVAAIEDRLAAPDFLTTGGGCDLGSRGQPLFHRRDMWKVDPRFRDLLERPRLLEALHLLTGGSEFRLWQDAFFYKPAGNGSCHSWHQDQPYLPIEPCGLTAIWVALTDVSVPSSGPMIMVPGSHRWGDATSVVDELGDPDEHRLPATYRGEEVTTEVCLVPKGSIHAHDGLTWHASLANEGADVRCGLLIAFLDGDARPDPCHPHAHKYPDAKAGRWDPTQHPTVSRQPARAAGRGRRARAGRRTGWFRSR